MGYGEPARLIPVAGIKGQKEAEDRAVSALLAVMGAVRPFGKSVLAGFGIRFGKRTVVEAYTQPEYEQATGGKLRADGLIRVMSGDNAVFEALVEAKTGAAKLDAEQLNATIDVARAEQKAAVISISNEIEPSPEVHPTAGVRARAGVAVRHLSWARIIAEAIKDHHHRGVDDPEQAWILGELIRYLTHPNSGVVEFADMGGNWVAVRDAVREDRLSRRSPEAAEICQRWDQLLSVAALRLSVETGADAMEVTPKAHRGNPRARNREFVDQLCGGGRLSGQLRVPDTIGRIDLTADLRASQVTASVSFDAPADGSPRARVNWLLRQLRGAPGTVLVDAYPKATSTAVTASLDELREDPMACVGEKKKPPARFRVRAITPLGQGRATKRKPGFIDSVVGAAVSFYGDVVQHLKPYVPRPPAISPQPPRQQPGPDTAGEREPGPPTPPGGDGAGGSAPEPDREPPAGNSADEGGGLRTATPAGESTADPGGAASHLVPPGHAAGHSAGTMGEPDIGRPGWR